MFDLFQKAHEKTQYFRSCSPWTTQPKRVVRNWNHPMQIILSSFPINLNQTLHYTKLY